MMSKRIETTQNAMERSNSEKVEVGLGWTCGKNEMPRMGSKSNELDITYRKRKKGRQKQGGGGN